MKKRWNATLAALVVGMSVGLAGSLGFAKDAPIPDCGRSQCGTNADCTSFCGGPGTCVKVDSCNRVCSCAM
jgi:hypothetical protein